jgi:hypothetical protein
MKTTNCLAIAICAIVVVGCGTTPVAKLAATQCVPPGISMDTCEYSGPPSNPNKAVCHVYVGGNKDVPVVYPYDLYVTKRVADVTIVWTLLDPGATFRDNNDGPNFAADPEFSDGSTTTDPNGGSNHGSAAKHYKTKFANTPNGKSHPYSITFKPGQVDSVRCDPTITNGGGV